MNDGPPTDGARAPRPVVSVIVPAHNYARYLAEAIASVQAQTFKSWECLVVDDGSSDDTPGILARLAAEDDRIRAFRQEQRGPASARNHALLHGRGRYVQFLDADDLLHPAKLETHVRALDAMGDVGIVHGPTRYFENEAPGVLRSAFRGSEVPRPPPLSGQGREVLQHLLVANSMTIEAALVRRSVFDVGGLFNERLRRMEDWEFWLRCAIAGWRFAFVPSPEPVALIRLHAASASHDETAMLLAEIPIRSDLRRSLPTAADRDVNRRRLDEVRATVGIRLGLQGDARGGLRYLVPAAVSQRRPRWLAWVMVLLLMNVPGGRRLFVALRSNRHPGKATTR